MRAGEKGRVWPWKDGWGIYSLKAELPTLRLLLVSTPPAVISLIGATWAWEEWGSGWGRWAAGVGGREYLLQLVGWGDFFPREECRGIEPWAFQS